MVEEIPKGTMHAFLHGGWKKQRDSFLSYQTVCPQIPISCHDFTSHSEIFCNNSILSRFSELVVTPNQLTECALRSADRIHNRSKRHAVGPLVSDIFGKYFCPLIYTLIICPLHFWKLIFKGPRAIYSTIIKNLANILVVELNVKEISGFKLFSVCCTYL